MMTNVKWKSAAMAVMMAMASVAARAEQKLGTVNLQKVFDGFYKTKQANDKIQEARGSFEKSGKTLQEDYTKANDELKKLLEGMNDPAISTEEKDRRKKEADGKYQEVKRIEMSINDFRETSNRSLNDQMRRMRDGILREIQDTVTEKAKAGGFAFIFDTAALSANVAPVFVYYTADNDLSEAVLTDLNKTAPADFKANPPSTDKSKDKK